MITQIRKFKRIVVEDDEKNYILAESVEEFKDLIKLKNRRVWFSTHMRNQPAFNLSLSKQELKNLMVLLSRFYKLL